jgi:glutamyl-Q tRNA(Asp) synthetase
MSASSSTQYRGRFAPSPTGPLHFGSLVAAVGSYLRARSLGGGWLLRIEDIDPPREVAGASDQILRTLEAFGLRWDGSVVYQSDRLSLYEDALADLLDRGLAYPCSCTRKEIQAENLASTGRASTVYPGLCRAGPLAANRRRRAIRIRVPDERIEFLDSEVGVFGRRLAFDCGDFALRRRDGLYAYQLVVVVDDAEQDVTEVVRGQDLLDSTPGQIFLQRQLGLPTPRYMHLPLVKTPQGEKLSKQTGAGPLDEKQAPELLHAAMSFLGLAVPEKLALAPVREQLEWGTAAWVERRTPHRSGAAFGAKPLESGR